MNRTSPLAVSIDQCLAITGIIFVKAGIGSNEV